MELHQSSLASLESPSLNGVGVVLCLGCPRQRIADLLEPLVEVVLTLQDGDLRSVHPEDLWKLQRQVLCECKGVVGSVKPSDCWASTNGGLVRAGGVVCTDPQCAGDECAQVLVVYLVVRVNSKSTERRDRGR